MPSSLCPAVPAPGAATKKVQLELVAELARRHLELDVTTEDFCRSSGERQVGRWVHQPMVAALDLLNAYERDRRGPFRMKRTYTRDARTRAVEVLKQYLHQRVLVEQLEERELRAYKDFCDDLVHHGHLFPARNKCSFVQTIAEVFRLLEGLHVHLLQESKTCATLLQRVCTLGANLLSDTLGYLVVTISTLPAARGRSLEPLVLARELSAEASPSAIGAAVRGILHVTAPLFQLEALELAPEVPLERARSLLEQEKYAELGLAPCMRAAALAGLVSTALDAFAAAHELGFFLAKVVVEFARVGELYGDYGAIASARVLHPLLDAVEDATRRLGARLQELDDGLDRRFVHEPALQGRLARRRSAELPAEARRCARERAHRAVRAETSHCVEIAKAIATLRRESAPERLPEIRAELQDTCARLGAVFRSEAFLRWAPPELAASSAHLLALSGGPSGPVLALPEAPGSDEVQVRGAARVEELAGAEEGGAAPSLELAEAPAPTVQDRVSAPREAPRPSDDGNPFAAEVQERASAPREAPRPSDSELNPFAAEVEPPEAAPHPFSATEGAAHNRSCLELVFAAPVPEEEAFLVLSRVALALQMQTDAPLASLAADREELLEELAEVEGGKTRMRMQRRVAAVASDAPRVQAFLPDATVTLTPLPASAVTLRAPGPAAQRAAKAPEAAGGSAVAPAKAPEGAGGSCSTSPTATPPPEPEPMYAARVARLGRLGRAVFVHDRRRVEVDGELRIYAPGSTTVVKHAVALSSGSVHFERGAASRTDVAVKLPGKRYDLRFPDSADEFCARMLAGGAIAD